MIMAPSEFRNSYRTMLKKNDYLVLATWHQEVTSICLKYDESLTTMIKNVRAAHKEARGYLNDNS